MDSQSHIKLETAKCVACGLCLPHCPTYELLQDESESPRGRLALMSALARDRLPLNHQLDVHLDRCLACRACEKVCPAKVAYGQALDAARGLIESNRSVGKMPRTLALLLWLVERPARLRGLARFLRLYQRSGLQGLLRLSRALHLLDLANLDAIIPSISSANSFHGFYPAASKTRGHITLFLGCQAVLSDRPALNATIRLLNRLGYDVRVPPGQGCCGALHLHSGRFEKYSELRQANIKAFTDPNEIIVNVASGCGATLKEYGQYPDGKSPTQPWSGRIMDINQFLADLDWPTQLRFRPMHTRIAVHDPCTLTNVLRQEKAPYSLLARIPGAEVIPLPGSHKCCGAAGAYHLTQPEIAHQLRAPKLAELARLAPDILVTSNPGCAAFLQAGLRQAGLTIEIMHPVVLLERQLED